MTDYIVAKSITKTVGVVKKENIVDNLSLTLKKGEVVGLLGPNGAGKTTTMKMLLGLMKITSGSAYMLGEKVPSPSSRKGVGFLPEAIVHPDYLTVWEYLKYHAKLNDFVFDEDISMEEKIKLLLEKVGMLEFKDRYLRECSKGMRQRTDIARILLSNAKIVFLDEPFSGLDPCGQVMLKDIIWDLKQQGISVLVNSHAVGNLADVCDRVCIMDKGKILVDDRLENLTNTKTYELVLGFDNSKQAMDFVKEHKGANPRALDENSVEIIFNEEKVLNEFLSKHLKEGIEIKKVGPIYLSLDQLFVKVLADASGSTACISDEAMDRASAEAETEGEEADTVPTSNLKEEKNNKDSEGN